MKDIHKRLKLLRSKLNLNQEDFSLRIGVSNATYSTIERGTRKLKIEEAAKISKSFDVTLDWLILGKGNIIYSNKTKKEVLQNTVDKLYNSKKLFNTIEYPAHAYKNRVHFILIDILKTTNFNKNSEEAKVHLFHKINDFKDTSFFLNEVKNEIFKLLENINEMDCILLLENKQMTINIIQEKIPLIDKKINSFIQDNEIFSIDKFKTIYNFPLLHLNYQQKTISN